MKKSSPKNRLSKRHATWKKDYKSWYKNIPNPEVFEKKKKERDHVVEQPLENLS